MSVLEAGVAADADYEGLVRDDELFREVCGLVDGSDGLADGDFVP
jgi:hypothetical protein